MDNFIPINIQDLTSATRISDKDFLPIAQGAKDLNKVQLRELAYFFGLKNNFKYGNVNIATEGQSFVFASEGTYPLWGNITVPEDSVYILIYDGSVFSYVGLPMPSININIVNTISDLRNTEGTEGQVITLLGYYEKGDKEPLNYVYSTTQGVDDGGAVINTGSGSWIALFNDSVKVIDFGCKKDDSSFDNAPLITKAFVFSINKKIPLIKLEGTYYVSSSIFMKRVLDIEPNKHKVFISNGELISVNQTPILRGEDYDVLSSQLLEFQNVCFRSTVNGLVLFSNNIIRTTFNNCDFINIRFCDTIVYLQSLYFLNCNIRDWEGIFLKSTEGCYDIKFETCLVEHGETFMYVTKGGIHMIAGLSITNCCIEGLSGGGIFFDGSASINITGNYFEQNVLGSIICVSSDYTEMNYSLNIQGNFFFANVDTAIDNTGGDGYYHIVLDSTIKSSIKTNTSTGNLCYLKSNISSVDFGNFVSQGTESNLTNKAGITKVYFGGGVDSVSLNWEDLIYKGSIVINNNYNANSNTPFAWVCTVTGSSETSKWLPIISSSIIHENASLNGNVDLNTAPYNNKNAIYFPVPVASWTYTGSNFPTTDRGMLEVLFSNDGYTMDCVQKYTSMVDDGNTPSVWTRRYLGYTGGWSHWVLLSNI